MMCARAGIAAAVLLLPTRASLGRDARGRGAAPRAWRQWLVIGAIERGVPFSLDRVGREARRLGVAAIANSTVPLFTSSSASGSCRTSALARPAARRSGSASSASACWRGPSRRGLVGHRGHARGRALVARVRERERDRQRSVSATPGPGAGDRSDDRGDDHPASVRRSLQAPTSMPDTDAILSLLALALLGTALAQLVLYRMLNRFGRRGA